MAASDTIRRDYATTQTTQPQLGIISQLTRNVVIVSTPGRQPPALEAEGRIASILAAIETAHFMQDKFKAMMDQAVIARQLSAEIDTEYQSKRSLRIR